MTIPRTLFNEDHDMFRGVVRTFISREITPHYEQWENDGIVPREIWKKAGDVGLLCPTVPEKFGGVGGDFRDNVVVTEEMARAGHMAPAFYLQSDVVAPYLVDFGTDEQRERWLPPMVAGEAISAVGMSEPSGGSDLAHLKTSARRDGDDSVINGQKVFITNGHLADLLVLAARTGPDPGAKGVTLFLVETDSPGFVRGRRLQKIGCKAQDTAELFFDDLRVPATAVLGEVNGGFKILMSELAQERLMQAVRAVQTSETAIEWTIDYAKQRDMFGKKLADFQNTQFALAQLSAEVLAQRVFLDRCIELHVRGELSAVDAARLKLTTTQLQGRVMDECLQFFGGWGYMWEYPIARAFVDARMSRVGGGAIEVMKQIIGRSLFE
ncbi:MAG TPA: acyl-CoA dehydrogenase family protein [Sporichthya sp.]|nr:acyl-CoA dehydrogenase family protein [Sporichthya sp.]